MRLVHSSVLFLVAGVLGCSSEVITPDDSGSTSSSSSSSSSGMGGGGAGGGGGAPEYPIPECKQDTDCVLVNDCCTCAGVPSTGPLPDCPAVECFATACN